MARLLGRITPADPGIWAAWPLDLQLPEGTFDSHRGIGASLQGPGLAAKHVHTSSGLVASMSPFPAGPSSKTVVLQRLGRSLCQPQAFGHRPEDSRKETLSKPRR